MNIECFRGQKAILMPQSRSQCRHSQRYFGLEARCSHALVMYSSSFYLYFFFWLFMFVFLIYYFAYFMETKYLGLIELRQSNWFIVTSIFPCLIIV